jgi:hypothetical protein
MDPSCSNNTRRDLHEHKMVTGQAVDTKTATRRSFWRERHGVSAVEFAFVLPIVVLLLGGIFQFGFAFFMQGHMSEVAREVSRRVAVGEFTQSEAISFAQSSLINPGVTYDVTVTLPDPSDPNDREMQVDISAPLKEISPIDILGLFQDGDLTTSVTRRMEFKE